MQDKILVIGSSGQIGTELVVEGKDYLIMRESDIFAIV